MDILLWVAVAIVAANIIFGAVLLIKFRAEGIEARHRRADSDPWKLGSSRQHLT